MKPTFQNWFLAATICLAFGQTTHAGSVYWDTNSTAAGSGAATGTWGSSAFWSTDSTGATATTATLPTANDDVFIAAGTNGTTGTITIDTTKVAGSVTIQEPAANPGVIISGGTSLTLGGGSSASKGLFVTGNGTHTVSTPLILNGANTIQNAGTGLLSITGGVSGTGDLTARNNSATAPGISILGLPVSITGGISNTGTNGSINIGNANGASTTGGLGSGVTSVTQDGVSNLVFINSDNSLFAGNYNIVSGTLQWAGTNASGAITKTNSASVINLGATSGANAASLNIVNNAVSGKVNNNINVRAGSTGTKSITLNSSVSFATTGEIILDDNLTLNPNTVNFGITLNGLVKDGVSGPKGIVKSGVGDLTLSAANSFSGSTTLTNGNLILTGSSGALPSTSGVSITGGTFRLNNTAAANNGNRMPDSTVITMTGGTLDFKNDAVAATSYSETLALAVTGTSTVTASQAAADGSSTLTIGTITRSSGGVLTFTGTGLGADARNRILFSTSPAINGVIPWATYGTTGFAGYDVTNGVVPAATTDIDATGSTITDNSTSNLRINADGTGGDIVLGSTTTQINTLVQANTTLGTTVYIDNLSKTLRLNGLLIPSTVGTQGLTIGANSDEGTLTAGTAGGELVLFNSSANMLTVNSVIADNTSASSVTKAGTGNATFGGTNTYTGVTNITGGIVTAATASAFGTGAVNIYPTTTRLVINDGLTLANNITFKGGGVSSRGIFENSGSGEATLSGTITIDGVLSGGGHFASVSTGTLKVTGAINSALQPVTARLGTVIFSGGGSYANFILNQGTAKLGATNGLSTSATADVAVSAAGNIDLNGYNQTLVGITRSSSNGAIIGNGSETSDSTLTTTGTSTYAGNIANVIGTPTTPKTTSLVVNSGNLTLTGGFTAQNITIKNTATLTIGSGGGDGIAPVSKLVTINNGGTLRYSGSNRVQNDTVIDIPSGATLDMNAQTDVIGHIKGAGSITNLTNNLTLSLPAVGNPAEFSGTISGTSTTTALTLRCDGLGASSASNLILSGSNTGLAATGTNSTVNVQGGRLTARNTAAFGASGQYITVGGTSPALDPTIEFQTDSVMNAYALNIGSGNTGTLELNRATPGPALIQPMSAPTFGNGMINFEKGANVTSGTPTLQIPSFSLTAGLTGLGASILNPVDVDINVSGGVTRPGTTAGTLKLDGTSTGNIISGVMQDNGGNKLTVIKQNTSTWTLAGPNTHTGTTTVNGGTLHLTGSLAAGSAVTVGGATATGTPTLTGAGGTVNGTLLVAAAGGGAAGTVNPGTVGTVGTLNVANNTTIAGTYACDVSGASSDLLAITGNLDITGATLAVSGTLTAPSYTIATYTGTLTGSFTASPALPAGYTLDTATAGQIKIVSSGTDYSAWMALYPSITITADKLPTADPDGDGLTNQVEYAFGLAPNSGSSVNPILVQLDKTAGTFTYQRRSSTGMAYTILKSTDLVTWTPAPATQTPGTPDANNVQTVAVTLTGAPLTADKFFVRVKAE